MRIRYILQSLRKFPSHVLWTARMIPAALRGELAAAYCTLSLVHIDGATGTRTDYGVVSRKKVTQAFVKRIAAQLAASFAGADAFKWHASGTGVVAESNADTALGTDSGVARQAGSQVDASAGTTGIYTSVGTMTYVSTLAITEHGLFSLVTGGTLLDRSVFAAVNVVATDSIAFTYSLTINPET